MFFGQPSSPLDLSELSESSSLSLGRSSRPPPSSLGEPPPPPHNSDDGSILDKLGFREPSSPLDLSELPQSPSLLLGGSARSTSSSPLVSPPSSDDDGQPPDLNDLDSGQLPGLLDPPELFESSPLLPGRLLWPLSSRPSSSFVFPPSGDYCSDCSQLNNLSSGQLSGLFDSPQLFESSPLASGRSNRSSWPPTSPLDPSTPPPHNSDDGSILDKLRFSELSSLFDSLELSEPSSLPLRWPLWCPSSLSSSSSLSSASSASSTTSSQDSQQPSQLPSLSPRQSPLPPESPQPSQPSPLPSIKSLSPNPSSLPLLLDQPSVLSPLPPGELSSSLESPQSSECPLLGDSQDSHNCGALDDRNQPGVLDLLSSGQLSLSLESPQPPESSSLSSVESLSSSSTPSSTSSGPSCCPFVFLDNVGGG